MRILVWQWGRRGAGPRVAAELAKALNRVPGVDALLSLSTGSELLRSAGPPPCALPVATYGGVAGFVVRLLQTPLLAPVLARRVASLRPDVALCAMPGPLDGVMASALRRVGLPFFVVVHDADAHPGDGLPFQMALQRSLLRRSAGLVALSSHVGDRLRTQGLSAGRPLLSASLPPLLFGADPPVPPLRHGGPLRLLSFGRLLPYKGLDLLADALVRLGNRPDLAVRVVGQGPESPTLKALRALPHVSVENRWVPEDELSALIAWSDALVLSHREASQSGPAAAAVAARRWVVSTRVGGLPEQLRDEPMAILCEPGGASLAAGLAQLLDEAARPPATDSAGSVGRWQETAGRLAADLARCLP